MTDQSYMNTVYDNYVSIDRRVWQARTPLGPLPPPHVMPACIQRADDLLRTTDSYHFFGRMAPWAWRPKANCTAKSDRSTVHAGSPSLCARPMVDGLRIDPKCSGMEIASQLWFAEWQRLPTSVRRVCGARLRARRGVLV